MKNLLLPIACVLFSHMGISQQTFEIQSLGSNYSIIQINETFETADFCGMYYSSERRELKFDDGTVVELFSSAELPNLDTSCFISSNGANDSNVWRINADGYLIRIIQTQPTKQ